MSIDDLERLAESVRERRNVSVQTTADSAASGEMNTNKFRILWDAACPEHPGAWGSTRDQMNGKEKITALMEVVDNLQEFLAWVAKEWHSLKFRSGTQWMAEKDMLPRHPAMRFVLHHWSHFHASYLDREAEQGFDYVDPNVDALLDDIGFLEMRLDEAASFGQEAQIARLKNENERLKIENARLRAQLTPFVDLDTELPTWEEKDAAKV